MGANVQSLSLFYFRITQHTRTTNSNGMCHSIRTIGSSSHTNEVDAITRALFIWQIMSQMCSIHRHGFAIFETADVLPVHVGITETGPTVGPTFHQEIFHATSALRCRKEQLARIRVVEVNAIHPTPSLLDKGRFFKVTRVFGVVTTERF